LVFDLLSHVIPRPRKPQQLILVATVALSFELGAQPQPGRYTKISLSDSMSVTIHLGGSDTSIVASTPEGIFRLAASADALASWAKASAALPAPRPQSGSGADGKMSLSASVLGATNQSGNAMRLLRLSADSPSAYSLAGSNGAWGFTGRVPREKVTVLFHALAGEAEGVEWHSYPPFSDSHPRGYREAEAAPGNPRPRYPPRAELALAAGEVVAQFKIGVDGRAQMESLMIVRSTHPLFSLAVREVLPSMRFLPATISGVPIETTERQEFQFKQP
jgi:hypothetical protein